MLRRRFHHLYPQSYSAEHLLLHPLSHVPLLACLSGVSACLSTESLPQRRQRPIEQKKRPSCHLAKRCCPSPARHSLNSLTDTPSTRRVGRPIPTTDTHPTNSRLTWRWRRRPRRPVQQQQTESGVKRQAAQPSAQLTHSRVDALCGVRASLRACVCVVNAAVSPPRSKARPNSASTFNTLPLSASLCP